MVEGRERGKKSGPPEDIDWQFMMSDMDHVIVPHSMILPNFPLFLDSLILVPARKRRDLRQETILILEWKECPMALLDNNRQETRLSTTFD